MASRFRGKSAQAAYFLIDLSELPKDVQDEIRNDAAAGGTNYGVRVVEQIPNGSITQNLFGVYRNVKDPNDPNKLLSNDEDRWAQAKKDLGISGSEVDDGDVIPMDGSDPRREAALREAAAQSAQAEADRIRAAEDERVREITGDTGENRSGGGQRDHTANIVDDSLSREAMESIQPDGTIVGEGADDNAPAQPKGSKNKSKTPR